MLSQSLHRFYVVPNYILPTMDDIKISSITFDMDSSYLNVQLDRKIHGVKHIPNIKHCLCKNSAPCILYKKKVDYYNKTVHNIMTKEIHL